MKFHSSIFHFTQYLSRTSHLQIPRRGGAFGLALIFNLILGSGPVWATLGEPSSSIDQDATQLKAVKVGVSTQSARGKATVRADGTEVPASAASVTYVVQELDIDGIQVKEFVNPGGVVFAVSWSGAVNPDFKTLFGANLFSNFTDQQHRQGITPGRRPAAVLAEGIRVERWGHMGNLHGRALVPQLIPTNFSIEVLQ